MPVTTPLQSLSSSEVPVQISACTKFSFTIQEVLSSALALCPGSKVLCATSLPRALQFPQVTLLS